MKKQNLKEHFKELTEFLIVYKELYKSRPFVQLPLTWESQFWQVSKWLRSFSLEDIENYSCHPQKIANAPLDFCKWRSLSQKHNIHTSFSRSFELPDICYRKIPWRKAEQIRLFTKSILPMVPENLNGFVDWCCGKGHLGRTLGSVTKLPVLFLEKQKELCEKGAEFIKNKKIKGEFACKDVLQDPLPLITPHKAVVALHACGELNIQLLKKSVSWGIKTLAIAPCCYHRIGNDSFYQPISQLGQKNNIHLDLHALRLAMTDEMVASDQAKKLRRQKMAWCLGFDFLVRQALKQDCYHPIPCFSSKLLQEPFVKFCQILSQQTNYPLPDHWNDKEVQEYAWKRLQTIRALGVAINLFRRPLETWLVLDRAMYLEENGYCVKVGTFCSPQITPRNLLIFAQLKN